MFPSHSSNCEFHSLGIKRITLRTHTTVQSFVLMVKFEFFVNKFCMMVSTNIFCNLLKPIFAYTKRDASLIDCLSTTWKQVVHVSICIYTMSTHDWAIIHIYKKISDIISAWLPRRSAWCISWLITVMKTSPSNLFRLELSWKQLWMLACAVRIPCNR